MKRFLICVLSLMLGVCLLGACGDDDNSSYKAKDSSVQGNYDHGGDNGDWSPAA